MTSAEVLQQLNSAGLRPPKTLTLAVTGACNLTCCHCWVEAGAPSAPDHVPVRLLKKMITAFAVLGGEGLRLTGGEPLCHPDWLELIRFSRSTGFSRLALQTNGMLFTDKHVAVLHEIDFTGLSIQISLDGATPAAHDLVRGAGAYAGTLAGIQKLAQAGFAGRISLFMTEMRHNLEDIPALLELADSFGINGFSSGTLVVGGRASEGSAVAPPDCDQYLRLLERYDTDQRFRELYQKIGTIAALEWRTDKAVRQEYCSFIENPYITPSGRIYPCLLCHADEFSITGLYEKGLAAALIEGVPLWSSLYRISRDRSDGLSECCDCPGRAICTGGCMGRAWGSCGDLAAADDRCNVRRTIYQNSQLC